MTTDLDISTQRNAAAGRRSVPAPSRHVWLTWMQHRATLLVLAALYLALAVLLLYVDSMLSALDTCAPDVEQCDAQLSSWVGIAEAAVQLTFLLPLVVGAFLGIPAVAREFEQRTTSLAWGQDVTPTRWLVGRWSVLSGVVVALTLAVAIPAARVSDELRRLEPNPSWSSDFASLPFELNVGLAVVYSWAPLSIGLALGLVMRRALPAIAVLVPVILGIRIFVREFARERFSEPQAAFSPPDGEPAVPVDAMTVVNNTWANADGSLATVPNTCQDNGFTECLVANDITQRVSLFHPSERITDFVLFECAAFALVAVACLVMSCALLRGSWRPSDEHHR